ncbi:MAG: acyl-CoA dehydrogenase family protein [Planctomycetota bacterium]
MPNAWKYDRLQEYPWEIKEALASAELMKVWIPKEYGGAGGGVLDLCVVVEELSRCCGGTGVLFAVNALGSFPILIAGTDEQKQKYLPAIASGEKLIAFGLSEKNAGSDAGGMTCMAERDGDEWVLNGSKKWNTNGPAADINSVFAVTDPNSRSRRISAFLLEKEMDGYQVGYVEDKMGIRCVPVAELDLTNVRVSDAQLLGGRAGLGFKHAMMTLDCARPGVAAQAVGLAQGAVDFATVYATQRHQFGKPISAFQMIQKLLADMATKVEAARALVYSAAMAVDAGASNLTKYAAMCKFYATDMAMEVTTDAVQVFGGNGYMRNLRGHESGPAHGRRTQSHQGGRQPRRARALHPHSGGAALALVSLVFKRTGMADPKTPPTGALPDPDLADKRLQAALNKVNERRIYYATLGILVIAVLVFAIVLASDSGDQGTGEFVRVWDRALAVRGKLRRDQTAREELALLEAMLPEVKDTSSEGITLWLLAVYHYAEANTSDKVEFEMRRPHLEKSMEFLGKLDTDERFHDMLLTKPRWFTDRSGDPVSALLAQIGDDLEWERKHAKDLPKPGDSTVAVLRTAIGDIHLKFYDQLAPEHVKQFVTLATSGAYNGTQFHYVGGGADNPVSVMGGDPYTFFYPRALTKEHILRWGQGGLGYELPPEQSRFDVVHVRGIVTSQRRPKADWDNATQFQIMLATDRTLDRVHTPFAQVVEGLDVVEKIAARKTADKHDAFRDDNDFASVSSAFLLVEPVEIYKVIVFRDGKALEHKFPLKDAEKELGSIAGAPAAAIDDKDALYAGRSLRAVDADGEIRRGLDVPYPSDIDTTDKDSAPSPKGDRETKAAPPIVDKGDTEKKPAGG